MKMRNLTKYFLGAAVLLAGSVGFTGCTDGDFDDVNSPDQTNVSTDGEGVNIELAFAISTSTTPTATRMTADNTQAGSPTETGTKYTQFRGMDEVHILPIIANNDDGGHVITPVEATRDLSFTNLISTGDITSTNERRILQASLPLKTNQMLFYGHAPKTVDYYQQGYIKYNIDKDLNKTYFYTYAILSEEANKKKFMQQSAMLSHVLNRIFTLGTYVENADDGDVLVSTTDPWNTITEGGQKSYMYPLVNNTGTAQAPVYTPVNINDENATGYRDLRISFWWPYTSGNKYGRPIGKIGTGGGSWNDTSCETAEALVDDGGSSTEYEGNDAAKTKYKFYKNVSDFWSDYGTEYAVEANRENMDELELILGKIYYEFTTLKPGEIRAGSGPAICRQIGDIWKVIEGIVGAQPTSADEFRAQQVARRIDTVFGAYFDKSGSGDDLTVTFKSFTDIHNRLLKRYNFTGETHDCSELVNMDNNGVATSDKFTGHSLNDFPFSLDVPRGSADLDYNPTTKKFSILYEVNSSGMVEGTEPHTSDIFYAYRYPAELVYFGNSAISTNTQSGNTIYPTTISAWKTADWSSYSTSWARDSHITTSTHSVAMQKSIHYGNALLETTVGYSTLTLHDNNAAINDGEPAKEITISGTPGVSGGVGLVVTGILIGGQPGTVDWHFLPIEDKYEGTNLQKFDCMVYDRDIPNGGLIPATVGQKSQSIYTLLWDNYNVAKAPNNQNKVYIGIEFQNKTGQDFWGWHNLIRNNQYFYIIGELDPNSASLTDNDKPVAPDNHNLPPYNEGPDGGKATGIDAPRIFIQDYRTKANFLIGKHSLKYAYVTVPDLRSSQIQLGLSVDLEWSNGYTFNDVYLGGQEDD